MDQRITVGVDLKTPLNASLSAFYKRSFAFHTVQKRLPVIITQTIDELVRKKENITKIYGDNDELKFIIGELSKLKYEIQTNKPFAKLQGNKWDIEQYNKYLEHQSINSHDSPTFYTSIWLHAECYMYRKIREAFELTNTLKNLDPFEGKKRESFNSSLLLMEDLAKYLLDVLEESDNKKAAFMKLLKLNLWGNKCDLSLSNGVVTETGNLMELEKLDPYILSDDSEKIWDALIEHNDSQIIDIVLDNAGYELYTDLCLADFLTTHKYVNKVRFYVKSLPWFVSDVMTKDFHWTLTELNNSDRSVLKKLANRWSNYVETKIWTVEEHDFWTLPVAFDEMILYDAELYRKLSRARLIIFKGDLNYRKLFGEKNWSPETPVEDALQCFNPSKLCTLRTLKADIICGLANGVAEAAELKDDDWLISGNYGVIQYCDKILKVD